MRETRTYGSVVGPHRRKAAAYPITPVAWGGPHTKDNLRLLCRTHNLLMARQMGLH